MLSKFLSHLLFVLALVFFTAGCSKDFSQESEPNKSSNTLLAFVGDFGTGKTSEEDVALEVLSNKPDAIFSLGDNVYSPEGYPALVGKYYGSYLNTGRFFPATGNHDYEFGIENFDSFFKLKSGKRYYSKEIGNIKVIVIDSQAALVDHKSMVSQYKYLKEELRDGISTFNVVVLHHPPFSSGNQHGSTSNLQWDFHALGVDLVISGHEHIYEHIVRDGVNYVISGTGGNSLHRCGEKLAGSIACEDTKYGAYFLRQVGSDFVGFFQTSDGSIIDSQKFSFSKK